MANEKQATPQVAIPLPPGKKNAVNIGGICLMLFIAFAGLSLALIQSPVLTAMDAMDSFSTVTILSGLGLAIMTPIGGKLGDMFGRRNIIMAGGFAAAVCIIGLVISVSTKNIILFMFFRLMLGAAQGVFTAAPYILVREVNEMSYVPKGMGLLTTAVNVGGFAGSILAGMLVDAGQILLAVAFPIIPLAIGMLLIWFNLPNKGSSTKPVIDWSGIVVLAVFLTALLLSLNYGSIIGWTNPIILVGFVVAIITGYIFVRVENKVSSPIVSMKLLTNQKYVVLLFVGWICYYYQAAMNTYAPLVMINVMNAPATLAGSLTLPRTIFSMVLPVVVGAWVAKKSDRSWKAMAIACLMYVITYVPLIFMNAGTPAIMLIGLFALTGIGDSFKSVAITPAAQATLDPSDIGVGTSLITFFNSTASLFAGAIGGALYNSQNPGAGPENMLAGVKLVFACTAIVSLIGLLLVVFVVRKHQSQS